MIPSQQHQREADFTTASATTTSTTRVPTGDERAGTLHTTYVGVRCAGAELAGLHVWQYAPTFDYILALSNI